MKQLIVKLIVTRLVWITVITNVCTFNTVVIKKIFTQETFNFSLIIREVIIMVCFKVVSYEFKAISKQPHVQLKKNNNLCYKKNFYNHNIIKYKY